MYEAPIKRAGISMNLILFSNTRMVLNGFPRADPAKFNVSIKYRTFENGKVKSTSCKPPFLVTTLLFRVL